MFLPQSLVLALPPLKKGGWGGFRLCALGLALLVGLIVNAPAHAAGLNDTGQTTCYDDTQAVTLESSTHPHPVVLHVSLTSATLIKPTELCHHD